LKQTAYEKKLKVSNETAKQKLKATAQDTAFSEALQKTFTRKEIGKMTGAEFVKNEAKIMEQLRKGLIK
jgi:tRNA U34 5-methylaminomethyl-2-thiouridine-forming methyltransferase MnmC